MAQRRVYLICLILAVLAIPLFFINIHHSHVWGDDHAQYLLEAVNIAKGKPYYQTNYIFNPNNPVYAPPHYPPGFPAMIAPIVLLKGIATRPIIYFIALILAALLYVLFFYFRRYTNDVIAVCLALICVYGSGIIELKGSVNSDIPCWLFVAIYFTMRNSKRLTNIHIAIMIAAGVMALMIRTQTGLLFVAEFVFLAIQSIKTLIKEKRIPFKQIINSPSFKILASSFLLYLLIDKILLPVPESNYSSLEFYKGLVQFHDTTLWETLGSSANYMFDLFIRSYHYYPGEGFLFFITRTITYIIMVFAILGFFIKIRKGWSVEDIYFIILFLFLIFFSQQQGVRFIIYMLPVYLLYAFLAARQILPQIMRVKGTPTAIVFTILFLSLGWWDCERSNKEDYKTYIEQNDVQAFEYLKQNIAANDIIAFEKPRVLSLYTGKKSIIASQFLTAQQNLAHFDSIGVKYVLFRASVSGENYNDIVKAVQHPVQQQDIAPGFILYTIR